MRLETITQIIRKQHERARVSACCRSIAHQASTCNPLRSPSRRFLEAGHCKDTPASSKSLLITHQIGKPLTSTLLTSTFVFRSGGFPFRGFDLEWSLVAPSLEGFSVTNHEKGIPGAPFKGIKRVRGAPPGTKNQSGHVKSGL